MPNKGAGRLLLDLDGEGRIVFVEGLGHELAQAHQGDQVRDDHEAVEHVGQLPDQVDLQHGAKAEEAHDEDAEEGEDLGAEEELGVLLGEEVPADDGGEGKEEQADGHEGIAQGAEAGGEGLLGELDARGLAVEDSGGEDDQGSHVQHDEGVNEQAAQGDHALLGRMLDLGHGVRVGRGTHAGLVGKQAPLDPLAQRRLERIPETASQQSFRCKRVFENAEESLGQITDAHNDHRQAAEQEKYCHKWRDFLRDMHQPNHPADQDQRGEERQNRSRCTCRDAECGLTGGTDGIHLDHAPHAAERQDDRYSEKSRQEDPEFAGKGFSDVVDRSASDRSVRHDDLGFLGEHRFRVDRRHRKEGYHPHPEDRPGPPIRIAPDAPTMLPVPTCAATAAISD